MAPSRAFAYAKVSIGFWGWYGFGYWASSRIYPVSADLWWFNQFGFCGILSLAIAAALIARKGRPSCKMVDWVSLGAGLTALFALNQEPLLEAGLPWLVAAALALGFSLSWSIVRWCSHYATLDARENLTLVLFGIMIASLVKILSFALPSFLVPWLFSAILVAMTILRREIPQNACPQPKAQDRYTLRTILHLWQTILSIAAFFALWSFLNQTFAISLGHLAGGDGASALLALPPQIIDIGFSLFMLWWTLRKKRAVDWTFFWQIGYFLLAVGLLIISYFGASRAVQVFLSASAELVFMFLVYFLVHIGRRSVYQPAVVVAIGYAAISLLDWAARAFAMYTRIGFLDASYAPAFLFAIVAMIVFFLPARSPGMHLLTAELQESAQRSGGIDDKRCRALGKERGLTPRELEVLVLFCRGRSAPYIAETLYLSENTVKTYRKRIYQKIGVHDKQELLDLLEQRDDQEPKAYRAEDAAERRSGERHDRQDLDAPDRRAE